MEVMFSSASAEWETPIEIFNALDKLFHFTLDPCCHEKTAKCKKFYTQKDDGLSKSWKGERVFVNPPYGKSIVTWIDKCWRENTLCVCLVPVRTDTRWWQEYCSFADEIWFIKGRLSFGRWNYINGEYTKTKSVSAPFPSAIVIFDNRKKNSIHRYVKLVDGSIIFADSTLDM